MNDIEPTKEQSTTNVIKKSLPAKYNQILVFGYWLLGNLKSENNISSEVYDDYLNKLCVFEDVQSQMEHLDGFFSDFKETNKQLKDAVSERKKSEKEMEKKNKGGGKKESCIDSPVEEKKKGRPPKQRRKITIEEREEKWAAKKKAQEDADIVLQTDNDIDYYRRSLAIDPNNHDYLLELGNALDKRGEHDEAAEMFRRALAIDPNHEKKLSEKDRDDIGALVGEKFVKDRELRRARQKRGKAMERKKKILSSSNDNTKKESCIDSPVEKRKRGRPPKKKITIMTDDEQVKQMIDAMIAAAHTPEAIEKRKIEREREKREREEEKEMNLHDKWDGESYYYKTEVMRIFVYDALRVGEGLRMYTKYILTDFCGKHLRNVEEKTHILNKFIREEETKRGIRERETKHCFWSEWRWRIRKKLMTEIVNVAPPLIRDYLPVADTSSYSSSVRRLTKAEAQAEAQASVTIDVLRSEGCSFHQFLSRRTTLPGYNSKPLSSVLMDELSRLKSKNMYIVKIINGRGTLLRIQKPTDVTKNILTDFCSNHLRYKSSSLKKLQMSTRYLIKFNQPEIMYGKLENWNLEQELLRKLQNLRYMSSFNEKRRWDEYYKKEKYLLSCSQLIYAFETWTIKDIEDEYKKRQSYLVREMYTKRVKKEIWRQFTQRGAFTQLVAYGAQALKVSNCKRSEEEEEH